MVSETQQSVLTLLLLKLENLLQQAVLHAK
jgi:hypothetical protein